MTMMMLPTDGPDGPGGDAEDRARREARVRGWGRREDDAAAAQRHAEIAATFRAMFRERVERLCSQP